MKSEIEKSLIELIARDYHWDSSFLKKLRLLIGFFYDKAPNHVINCSENINHHIQLENYKSTLKEIVLSLLASNTDVAKNLEQYKELLARNDFDDSSFVSAPNFYIDKIEVNVDIKFILNELKKVNKELKEIKTNYSEVINWIYREANEQGYLIIE
jgi:hypothetical protein